LPECGSERPKIKIKSNQVPSNTDACKEAKSTPNIFGVKIIPIGITSYSIGKSFSNLKIHNCYDPNSKSVKFNVNNNNEINVDYSIAICDDEINKHNKHIIKSIDELNNIDCSVLKSNEYYNILSEFVRQQLYPLLNNDWLIYEAVQEHEKNHGENYKEIFENTENYKDELNNVNDYSVSCSDFNKNSKNNFQKSIDALRIKLEMEKNKYKYGVDKMSDKDLKTFISKADPKDIEDARINNLAMERATQAKASVTIQTYINKLKELKKKCINN